MNLSDESPDRQLQEACGLFGCVASGDWPTQMDVAHIIYLGLIGLQHRGQESAGITTSRGDVISVQTHKGLGLVSHGFKEEDLKKLNGNLGIGHTRYSTLGGTEHLNTQPFVVHTKHGILAIAHNGELVNAAELRKTIVYNGVGLSTESDSELMVQILSMPPPHPEKDGPDWPARIRNLMQRTKIAYSLLVMTGDTIYAVRDPFGNRPLCLGELMPPGGTLAGGKNSGEIDGYVVSSESSVFLSVGGRLMREVEPGEIVEVTRHGCRSLSIEPRPADKKFSAFCIFEYVYFARPDSQMEGQAVYTARIACGKQLAIQAPADADVVSFVPESAAAAAKGFSLQSDIPLVEVLFKNRYVGRTFIQPNTRLRQLAVLKKFGPLSCNFKGKRIVLVDDSIVRGNTIKSIIRLLKDAGAQKVHVRIASPPLRHPCYMGINIPTKEELIANKYNAEELAAQIDADSLEYLTVENLVTAVKRNRNTCNNELSGYCTACLTGDYPIKREEEEW